MALVTPAEAEKSQIEKRCYKNMTAGWLGVVTLDYNGQQQGYSIEPYGEVWLTDAEAILTARAPADPKNNPFIEQPFLFVDQATGQHVEKMMRPLVPTSESKYSPAGERYVPPDVAAAIGVTEAKLANADPATEIPAPDSEAPMAPSSLAAVPPSQAVASPAARITTAQPDPPEADQPESWVDNPNRTESPVRGELGGANEPSTGDAPSSPTTPPSTQPPPAPPAPPSTVPVQPPPPPPVSAPVESPPASEPPPAPPTQEETAATTAAPPIEEETGAAVSPQNDPPEGEFAANEEVGTPDAPAAPSPPE